MKIPRITLILLLLVVVSAVVLGFVILKKPGSNIISMSETEIQPQSTIVRTAEILFIPEALTLKENDSAAQTVDLVISSKGSEASGVQVKLSYDPEAITNVRLTPELSSSFGDNATVLFNEVNQNSGVISYAIAIGPNAEPFDGLGKIATITFTKRNNPNAIFPTDISFLDETIVTTLESDDSILLNAKPFTLIVEE